MKKIFFAFFVIAGLSAHAQIGLQWVKKLGNATNLGVGNSIAVDAAGNVYTTGTFSGTVDFNPGAGVSSLTSVGIQDVFVSKLNAAGNFVWAKSIGGGNADSDYDAATSIAVDTSGNVCVTGAFGGTVDFNPGAAVDTLTSAGDNDIFILKLSSSGNFLWAQNLGGVNVGVGGNPAAGDDKGTAVGFDPAGNVYAAGYFYGTADFDAGPGTHVLETPDTVDMFVIKLDASGGFIWAQTLPVPGATGMAVDATGSVYVTGFFSGTVDADPATGTAYLVSAGSDDVLVLKLDAAGNYVWARNMGGAGPDRGNAVTIDAAANVYTTGYFSGVADFNPGAAVNDLASSGTEDMFVSKLDAAGNYVWAQSMSGDAAGQDFLTQGYSIRADAAGNVYTTGTYRGSVDFDPGSGTDVFASQGYTDLFLLKLNTSGSLSWAYSIGSVTADVLNSLTAGRAMALDTAGKIYVTGNYMGTVDFDPNVGSFESTGYDNVFVLKLYPCLPGGPITGASSVCSGTASTYSVEPIAGVSTYHWTVPAGSAINSGQNTTSINVTFGTGSGNITVIPGNSCGVSSESTLSLTSDPLPALIINAVPSPNVCEGSSVTLNVTGAAVYLWSDSTVSNGVTLYPTADVTYSVIGTDANGCTGAATVSLVIVPLPTVVTQPTDQTLSVGSAAQFTVTAVPPSAYQWQTDSGAGFQNVDNTGQYNGAGSDSLTVNDLTMVNNGQAFRCLVTSAGCSVVSDTATLTVYTATSEITEPNPYRVYPNPTTGSTTIDFYGTDIWKNAEIRITDPLGRLVYHSAVNQRLLRIERASLGASGIFFLYLTDRMGRLVDTRKLVLE